MAIIEPPKDNKILIDGQEYKFHYSREERLNAGGITRTNKEKSIFAKGNRHKLIIIFDITLVFLILFIYFNFFGKRSSFEENGIEYLLIQKKMAQIDDLIFIFEIKNTTNENHNIDYPIFNYQLYSGDSVIRSGGFTIDQNQLASKENINKLIVIEKPPAGEYKMTLSNGHLVFNHKFRYRP